MTGPGRRDHQLAVAGLGDARASGAGCSMKLHMRDRRADHGRVQLTRRRARPPSIIEADRIDLAGADTFVGAQSRARDGQNGGSFAEDGIPVYIRAGEVSLTDGGQILSVTRAQGDGADIDVEVDTLRISGIRRGIGPRPTRGNRLQRGAARVGDPRGSGSSAGSARSGSLRGRHRDPRRRRDPGVLARCAKAQQPGQERASVSVEATGSCCRDQQELPALGNHPRSPRFRDAGDLAVEADELQVLDGAAISATTRRDRARRGSRVSAERVQIAGHDDRRT